MNLVAAVLLTLVGYSFQERVLTFSPPEGDYDLVSGVCMDPFLKKSEDAFKPRADEIRKKLIQSISYQGDRVAIQLGSERHSCSVTELYNRVESFRFDETKGRSRSEAYGESEVADFWVLELVGVETDSCSEKLKKEITREYQRRTGKERLYVKFQSLILDRLHDQHLLWIKSEFDRWIAENDGADADLYSFTLLDEEWFEKEKLSTGRKGLGKDASLRPGEGIMECGPVREFVFSYRARQARMDAVPLGLYSRRLATCWEEPVPMSAVENFRRPYPMQIQVSEKEVAIDLKAETCKVRMTYEKAKPKRERFSNGVMVLKFPSTHLRTEVLSCPSKEVVKETEKAYNELYFFFHRSTEPFSEWQIGSRNGVHVKEPQNRWIIDLAANGVNLDRQFSCEKPIGVYYEYQSKK